MELSHIDGGGNAVMVNVGDKKITARKAVAEGFISMLSETVEKIKSGEIAKGNVLTTAKIAGIYAAKNTAGLIPLCHTVPLNGVDIEFELAENKITITASAYCDAKTGVEMEALTAVSVAALTVYDMVKAIDKEMEIGGIRLLYKSGGRSGEFKGAGYE